MKRLAIRKIWDALRLQQQGLSPKKIGASIGVGHSTVQDYLSRAHVAGLSWLVPDGLSDGGLEHLLFPRSSGEVGGLPAT